MDTKERKNRWVNCKGCGKPCGLFPEGLPPHLPKNAVGHAKAFENLGKYKSTGCDLYNRLDAKAFIALHDDAPSIQQPDSFKPLSN